MPQLRTKQELASIARAFAVGYKIVEHRSKLYMPVDFETMIPKPKDPERTIWVPIEGDYLRAVANITLHVLFANRSEEESFRFMVRQWADKKADSSSILVRIGKEKVAQLNGAGELVDATGEFIPNYLNVPYDPNNPLVEECFNVIAGWLNSEEQAHSLLYHLATALQTQWSARKYVLLIGEGYNGKGTLLKMILALFNEELNISGVTRQQMSETSVVIQDLNGKLLNIVMDGPKEFIKDSSTEKTLIAGEQLKIELKYENLPVRIQTNALFIEGLNTEPITSDKSPAVQKRLARFKFPNVYLDDQEFTDKMKSPEMVAAFLQLLLQHWVHKSEIKTKLALTAESLDLQMEAVWNASPVLRYLEYMASRDAEFLNTLLAKDLEVNVFLEGYRQWMNENGYKNVEDSYLLKQLSDSFIAERKTRRMKINGVTKPTTRRWITGIQPDTLNAINALLESNLSAESKERDLLNMEED